ncbi:MAG: hypothetical protein RLY19_317 [Actinomycetota bacterium]
MSIAAQHRDIANPDLGLSRLSVRAARIGIVAVLVAALALGLASLRYGSNNDPADAATALTLSNQ